MRVPAKGGDDARELLAAERLVEVAHEGGLDAALAEELEGGAGLGAARVVDQRHGHGADLSDGITKRRSFLPCGALAQ